MKKIINCAVIGLGVGVRHAYTIYRNKFTNLKVLCDFDKKKLSKYSKVFPKAEIYENSNKLFYRKDIDLVIIASYDNFHYQHIKKCILNKMHFFVEKPFCINRKEFHNIQKLLNKNTSIKFSSNLLLRNHPFFKKAKKDNEIKSFGKIYHYEASYNYGRLFKLKTGWRGKIPFYSVVLGGGLHLIDLILFMNKYSGVKHVFSLGNKISTLNSRFKFNDIVTTIIKFKNNVTAKITSNFSCVMAHNHVFEIYGTKKTIKYGFNKIEEYFSRDKNKKSKKINFKYSNLEKSKILDSFILSLINKKYKPIISSNEIKALMDTCFKIEDNLNKKKLNK